MGLAKPVAVTDAGGTVVTVAVCFHGEHHLPRPLRVAERKVDTVVRDAPLGCDRDPLALEAIVHLLLERIEFKRRPMDSDAVQISAVDTVLKEPTQ